MEMVSYLWLVNFIPLKPYHRKIIDIRSNITEIIHGTDNQFKWYISAQTLSYLQQFMIGAPPSLKYHNPKPEDGNKMTST